MKDLHDITFKSLMSHRTFFKSFFREYLPANVFNDIDWETSQVFNISGEHIREVFPFETQERLRITKDIADLAYIIKKKGDETEEALITLHVEHQSKPDKLLPLRMGLYIIGMLYEYAKINKTDKLPHVHSIIYYQGKQSPYPYSKDVWSMFPKDYPAASLLSPIFIDLGQLSDETLLTHRGTGAAEIAFKHIHEKNLLPYTDILATSMRNLDDNTTRIVLQYVLQASSDLDNTGGKSQQFIEQLTAKMPEQEETIMSIIDQLSQKKIQDERLSIARKMQKEGISLSTIKACTGVDLSASS